MIPRMENEKNPDDMTHLSDETFPGTEPVLGTSPSLPYMHARGEEEVGRRVEFYFSFVNYVSVISARPLTSSLHYYQSR